jgi:DUF2934 family protein
MAKRTTPRSQANETSAAPSRAKSRRPPVMTTPEADTIGAYPGVERSEDDGTVGQVMASPEPGASGTSQSPSEHDIRERAYHRYLTRGAHQGSEFDDWVEAERELKNRR